MGFFYPPEEEDYIFSQVDLYRQRNAQYRQSANIRTAQLMAAYKDQYPWMQAGAILPLAKAGLDPGSPAAQLAAQRGAKRKVKKGFGWHSFGDVVAATGRGIGGVAKSVGGAVSDVAKPVARTAFMALDAPYQAAQGGFRNIVSGDPSKIIKNVAGGGVFDFSQSHLGVAAEQLVEGEEVDTGSGFLVNPESGVGKEQTKRAQAAGSIDGHAITPGRLVAHTVVEPDTNAYNVLSGLVDASVAIALDPSAKGLGKSSKFREANKVVSVRPSSKLREAAGLVKGVRPAVMKDVADQWLASKDGRKVVDFIAGESNWDNLWKTFKKQIPVETINDLTDARTADEVRDILRPVLGVEVREKPYMANALTRAVKPVGGYGIGLRKRTDGVRLLQTMPGPHFDLDDLDQAVEQMDRWTKNAKLPAELIAKNNEALARSQGRPEALRAVINAAGDVAEHLGLSKTEAQRLTRLFEETERDLVKFAVDEVGENMHVPGAIIDGTGHALPTPHIFPEYINRTVPIPDVRAIKRATSFMAPLWKVKGVDASVSLLNDLQQDIWKPFTLIRGAWTVRVIGEEQLRMGGAGLESVFSGHPISALAWVTGRRGDVSMTGDLLADAEEIRGAMSRGSMGFRDRPGIRRLKDKVLYDRASEHFASSWAEEVSMHAADPLSRQIAATSKDEAAEWFWDGPGREIRKSMAAAGEPENVPWSRTSLLTREGADAYIDTVVQRLENVTAGQSDLMDAIATRKFGDEVIGRGDSLGKQLKARLRGLADEEVGPQKIKGDRFINDKTKRQQWDRAVEWGFNTFMSKPTNWVSRSPAARQFYWKRAEELVGHLTPEAQAELLENAAKANLKAGTIKRIAARAKAASGDVDIERADMVAKAFALDSTKDLLYDLSEKSQWADAVRLIMPFAEAWKEILTRWARIGFEHPETIRRGQQLVQGARGAGFFYESPQTGEEVFAYPGSKFVNDKLLGIPLPVEGSVSGLNLFSQSVIPGVGPVVQIPAAALLPDKPEWDEVRKLIFPAGEVEGPLPSALLPSWFKKLQVGFNGPDSDRLFNNTVMDTAAYLISTGDYTTDTEEGIDKLLEDAKKKARWLYVIRGFTQFGAPTAPQPLEVVKDKTGRIHAIRTLSNEFHEKEDEIGYQEAVAWFLDKYGEGASQILQAKTEGGGPPTKAGFDFVREHPEIARKFPEVYGYFLPKDGEIDFAAYDRQLESGERKPLDSKEQIYRGNSRLAIAIYQQAKSKVSDHPSKAEREWLRGLKDLLVQRYPGFEPSPADMGKTDRKIRALEQLADDPAVADTDAAAGLRLYLSAREKAEDSAKGMGLTTFKTAQKAQGVRDWLRDVGELIAERHPDFAPMWEQVFDREMKKDAA